MHVSQLADQFVSDPQQIVKVGQVVKVRVLEVNEGLKRISLSMKASSDKAGVKEGRGGKPSPQAQPRPQNQVQTQEKRSPDKRSPEILDLPSAAPTMEDLKAKFGKRR